MYFSDSCNTVGVRFLIFKVFGSVLLLFDVSFCNHDHGFSFQPSLVVKDNFVGTRGLEFDS